MRARSRLLVTGLAMTGLFAVLGCTVSVPAGAAAAGGGGTPQFTAEFDLTGGLGTFEVQAGVPAENRGTSNFTIEGGTISSGSVELDPSVITVTPAAGTNKANVAMQANQTLIVTVQIAQADQIDTVCDVGEQYGPFTVVLDENYVPVSIDPSTVTLSQNTIDLINLGQFSICLRVESPVDGTVTIQNLVFNLQ